MKEKLITEICQLMTPHLSSEQSKLLNTTLQQVFSIYFHAEDEKISSCKKDNNRHLIEPVSYTHLTLPTMAVV